jgi:TPP-dependent pyruvate/acetoin dehydrogenase alpha subunit
MPAWPVDGMDVVACEEAARRALAAVRGGGGPCFLEFRTYRFRAHSMFDPQLYREKQEVEEWKKRDPILAYGARLRESGLLNDETLKGIEDEVTVEIDKAVEFAEAAPWEPVADLTRFVYSERTRP